MEIVIERLMFLHGIQLDLVAVAMALSGFGIGLLTGRGMILSWLSDLLIVEEPEEPVPNEEDTAIKK
jgi:hypothetical protein